MYPFRPITFPANLDGGPPPYVPPGQRVRRSRNEVLPALPSYEEATKMPSLRSNNGNVLTDESDVVLNGQLTPIQNQELSRQESITSNDSTSTISSTSNHGRACSIEYDSENHTVIHQNQPDNVARNLSEQVTSNNPDDKELSRESSLRKSL